MSNLSTKLKTWGAQGAEYPDGYQYLEDEEPVDAWDNYLIYNVIGDIESLIGVVNERLESESAAAFPSSPEVGHLVHRTDAPENDAHEEVYYRDGSAGTWNRLLRADGDTMSGALDMGGNEITDATGTLALGVATSVTGDLSVSGAITEAGEAVLSQSDLDNHTATADAHHTRYSNSEARTAVDGSSVSVAHATDADNATSAGDADTVDGKHASDIANQKIAAMNEAERGW